ncbi:MAG: hypothetical protein JW891_03570 [Candidatus Lokiarchaeota archaeon]|nr:hypothetical protein [Candidatus Lokiarchaeota archaeon]
MAETMELSNIYRIGYYETKPLLGESAYCLLDWESKDDRSYWCRYGREYTGVRWFPEPMSEDARKAIRKALESFAKQLGVDLYQFKDIESINVLTLVKVVAKKKRTIPDQELDELERGISGRKSAIDIYETNDGKVIYYRR